MKKLIGTLSVLFAANSFAYTPVIDSMRDYQAIFSDQGQRVIGYSYYDSDRIAEVKAMGSSVYQISSEAGCVLSVRVITANDDTRSLNDSRMITITSKTGSCR